MSNNKKKKRKKVTYIDDGRTLYDMSSVGGGRRPAGLERGGCKEQIATYLNFSHRARGLNAHWQTMVAGL